MLHFIDHNKMGRGSHGWLDSHFHFSFAEYYNPDNIRFGALRVLNDDIVQPKTGFSTHPHSNMEIISYVVRGELSHEDSMGNAHTLTRGQAQYMSAGTGVWHSEFNWGAEELRFMQMWIFPDKDGYSPNYGDYNFVWGDRASKWMPIASGYGNKESAAPIRIHADVNIYAAELPTGESLVYSPGSSRQAYLTLLEGGAIIEDVAMAGLDALEIIKQDVKITAKSNAHLYVIDMPYDQTCYKEKYGDKEILRNGV